MITPTNFNDTLRRLELTPRLCKDKQKLEEKTLKVLKDVFIKYSGLDFFHYTENPIRKNIDDENEYLHQVTIPKTFTDRPEKVYEFFRSIYNQMEKDWKTDMKPIGGYFCQSYAIIYVHSVPDNTILKVGLYETEVLEGLEVKIQYLVVYGYGDEIYDCKIPLEIIKLLSNKSDRIICRKDSITIENLFANINYRTLKLLLVKKILNSYKAKSRLKDNSLFDVTTGKNSIVITFK